jgi:integrase
MPTTRSNFTRTWRRAIEAARLTDIHFHDLRHRGNNLAAATGASLRELTERIGHRTTRAALICQDRTAERARLLPATSELAEKESPACGAVDNGH